MKGNKVLLTADPRGIFVEGIISGTPKPGTLMEMTSAAAVGGRDTYQVYQPGTDGERRPIIVLLEDSLQGKDYSQAYVSGDRCFMYIPAPGEELNMLISAAGTGTGDAIAKGGLLIADTGTGLLVATTGGPESEPFQALEAQTDVVLAGTMTHCRYTGY